MNKYKLKIKFQSQTLVGSGEGFGAIIDNDIVFDTVGIPYIPAKRIKGCLRDSALEVQEMLDLANLKKICVDMTFGSQGNTRSGPVYFSNLMIENYDSNRRWLEYFLKTNDYNDFLSKEAILETFTEIRQQTKIDPVSGTAYDHSLRTLRVLNKDLSFFGDISIDNDSEDIVTTLLLACMNFTSMGTGRNRGFGDLTCTLFKGKKALSIADTLEEICTA